MQGQQGLVGRHDILARFEEIEHSLAGPFDTADQLDGHLDGRIVEHGCQIGRHQVRESGRPRFGRVAHHHMAQNQRTSGAHGEALVVLQQQPGDAAAHRPTANQGNAE